MKIVASGTNDIMTLIFVISGCHWSVRLFGFAFAWA